MSRRRVDKAVRPHPPPSGGFAAGTRLTATTATAEPAEGQRALRPTYAPLGGQKGHRLIAAGLDHPPLDELVEGREGKAEAGGQKKQPGIVREGLHNPWHCYP